jgi:hypothetical protein
MGILFTPLSLCLSVQLRGAQGHSREEPEVCHTSDFERIEQVCDCRSLALYMSRTTFKDDGVLMIVVGPCAQVEKLFVKEYRDETCGLGSNSYSWIFLLPKGCAVIV